MRDAAIETRASKKQICHGEIIILWHRLYQSFPVACHQDRPANGEQQTQDIEDQVQFESHPAHWKLALDFVPGLFVFRIPGVANCFPNT
jgi:hypothetical protein